VRDLLYLSFHIGARRRSTKATELHASSHTVVIPTGAVEGSAYSFSAGALAISRNEKTEMIRNPAICTLANANRPEESVLVNADFHTKLRSNALPNAFQTPFFETKFNTKFGRYSGTASSVST
jgi:hypothetical protein